MKIFIDSDVLLDVLLKRTPHFKESAAVLDWAESNPGSCAVSWHSLANIHYLSRDGARDFIRELLTFCHVPSTGTDQMLQALELRFHDLEDAMQAAAATCFGAQLLCTRNLSDFTHSPIPAVPPVELNRKLH